MYMYMYMYMCMYFFNLLLDLFFHFGAKPLF